MSAKKPAIGKLIAYAKEITILLKESTVALVLLGTNFWVKEPLTGINKSTKNNMDNIKITPITKVWTNKTPKLITFQVLKGR